MGRALAKAVLVGTVMMGFYCAWIVLSQIQMFGRACEVMPVVEVLNGCGTGGIAGEVGGLLADQGFDVMFLGNADDFHYDETVVIDRSGDRSKAHAVATALGGSPVVYQVSSAFIADVTVIVGSDMARRSSSGKE